MSMVQIESIKNSCSLRVEWQRSSRRPRKRILVLIPAAYILIPLNASLFFITSAFQHLRTIQLPVSRERIRQRQSYPATALHYQSTLNCKSMTRDRSHATTAKYFINRNDNIHDDEFDQSLSPDSSNRASSFDDIILPSWSMSPPVLRAPLLNVGSTPCPSDQTQDERHLQASLYEKKNSVQC